MPAAAIMAMRSPRGGETPGGTAEPPGGLDMPKRTCVVDGCDVPTYRRDWCRRHYRRLLKYGDAEYERYDHERLFWAKVDRRGPDECWPWVGAFKEEYGVVARRRVGELRYRRAHRVAYELVVGPIPDDLVIDHLCRNTACVNPAHLEAVTNVENVMRGEGACATHARQTHCIYGHPFDAANTYWTAQGHRQCRECQRRWGREWMRRKRAESKR